MLWESALPRSFARSVCSPCLGATDRHRCLADRYCHIVVLALLGRGAVAVNYGLTLLLFVGPMARTCLETVHVVSAILFQLAQSGLADLSNASVLRGRELPLMLILLAIITLAAAVLTLVTLADTYLDGRL
jgi:hypothetical protein